jgi:hypothetical protein
MIAENEPKNGCVFQFMKKQPLLVHTIFHPSSPNRKLAFQIHRRPVSSYNNDGT